MDEFIPPPVVGSYRILDEIGRTPFSAVFRAEHLHTLTPIAIKIVPKCLLITPQAFESLQRELFLLKSMDSPFIVTLYEVLEHGNHLFIALELLDQLTLLEHINTTKGLPESQAKRLFYQLALSLAYLHHEKRVVHRNLKAENIHIDKSLTIKIEGFNLSKSFTPENPFLQTTCGSPAYLSPEIIREEPYTIASDVWAAGVLLYAMVCGSFPFDGENVKAMLDAVLTQLPAIPLHLSVELRALLKGLLTKEPHARIKTKAILEHPWLAECVGMFPMADGGRIADALRVMPDADLDGATVGEMKALSIDVKNLEAEIVAGTINDRTAIYKILRRQAVAEALGHCTRRLRKRVVEIDITLPSLYSDGLANKRSARKAESVGTASAREVSNQLFAQKRGGHVPSTTSSRVVVRRRSLMNPWRSVVPTDWD